MQIWHSWDECGAGHFLQPFTNIKFSFFSCIFLPCILWHPPQEITIQYGKFPSTMPDTFPCWCAELGTLLRWVGAGMSRNQHTRYIYCVCLTQIFGWPFLVASKILFTFLHVKKVFLTLFNNFINYCWPFLLLWPFSWPFWASFTGHMCQDSLVHQEFHDPDVPSMAQAMLCWMHPTILGAITLLGLTYSA